MRVLDVGGGTGLYRRLFSPSTRYLWLDIDPKKLVRLRRAHPDAYAVLGDATRLCFTDRSVDLGLCVALSHHLSERQLPCLFRELARVVCDRLVFLDAVECGSSWISRLLWWLDDGAFPRRAEVLLAAIGAHFAIEHVEEYRVYHRYVLCIAHPRDVSNHRQAAQERGSDDAV